MYNLVIIHEDGAVASATDLPRDVARWRFEAATQTDSVVYAHYSGANYRRVGYHVRKAD